MRGGVTSLHGVLLQPRATTVCDIAAYALVTPSANVAHPVCAIMAYLSGVNPAAAALEPRVGSPLVCTVCCLSLAPTCTPRKGEPSTQAAHKDELQ